MRRFLFGLGALCWFGCGSEEATIIPSGEAGTGEPRAGSGGAAVGAAGTGAGGGGASGVAGSIAGSGGVPAEQPNSELIDVAEGDFNAGAPPDTAGGEALPQIVNLTGPAGVTNGGTAILHIQLSTPVASPSFVIGLEGDTGYHTVIGTDPDGDGVYDVTVQVAGESSQSSLVLSVALMDAMGNVGDYSSLTIPIILSGTGDVKVTLSFDRVHDLDLHVIEPNGEEISFTNDASATGGKLDLDSGSNCMPSAANTENIFWPPGGAPPGEYVVLVQNYQQCTAGPIEFTVRVAYDTVINTYTGSFPDGSASETGTPANLYEVVRFVRGVAP